MTQDTKVPARHVITNMLTTGNVCHRSPNISSIAVCNTVTSQIWQPTENVHSFALLPDSLAQLSQPSLTQWHKRHLKQFLFNNNNNNLHRHLDSFLFSYEAKLLTWHSPDSASWSTDVTCLFQFTMLTQVYTKYTTSYVSLVHLLMMVQVHMWITDNTHINCTDLRTKRCWTLELRLL